MKAAKRSKLEKEAVQTVIVNVEEVSNSSIYALESYDMEIEETNQNLQVQFSGSKSRKPRISHKITPEEKKILLQLEKYKKSPLLPKLFVNKLVEELSVYENWTSKRIRDRWYNKYRRPLLNAKQNPNKQNSDEENSDKQDSDEQDSD